MLKTLQGFGAILRFRISDGILQNVVVFVFKVLQTGCFIQV